MAPTNILPWIHIPVLIYNTSTFNSIKILKSPFESDLYFGSEYIIKLVWHVQGFVPTHEIWLQSTNSHESIFQFKFITRAFNWIEILKKLVETHFYSASKYIIMLVWHVQGIVPHMKYGSNQHIAKYQYFSF